MSAARVFNPAVLSEFCKIGAAAPTSLSRAVPCGRQIQRVKRDLFGATNSQEIHKIFTEQVAEQQEAAAKKWGFDFRAGLPLANSNTQFVWERISQQESCFAPEMYTLTRAAHVRPAAVQVHSELNLLLDERAEREHNIIDLSTSIDTDSCDESQDESMVVFKVPAAPKGPIGQRVQTTVTISENANCRQLRKRQPRITEYMKERKRLTQSPKKMSPPAKRMRSSPNAANTNSSSSSSLGRANHSVTPHSIFSHFSLRSQRHY